MPDLRFSGSIEAPHPQGRASRKVNFINIAPLDPAYKAGLAGHLPVSAEPAALVKCICGRWWVIGDYDHYLSLTPEEKGNIKTWNVNFYKNHGEWSHHF